MRTMRQYLDELKIRLNRKDLADIFNDVQLNRIINRSRRLVQSATLDGYQYLYGKTAVYQNINSILQTDKVPHYIVRDGYVVLSMPDDLLDVCTVEISYKRKNIERRTEARKVSQEEENRIAKSPWTSMYTISPTYYLRQSDNWQGYEMVVAGINPQSVNISNLKIYINYLYLIKELEYVALNLSDTSDEMETELPLQLQELVLLYSLLHCRIKFTPKEGLQQINEEIASYEELIGVSYAIEINEQTQETESQKD